MADELQRCRRELLKFIQLIMSTKSKEVMQIEALRHIITNESAFHEYILAVIDKADDSSNKSERTSLANEMTSHMIDLVETDPEDKNASSHEVNRCSGQNGTNETSEESRRSTKRKRSKYENVDFSHLYREPKTSKYKKMTNKATKKLTQKDLKDIVSNDTTNNASENERIKQVCAVMNAILQARCQQSKPRDARMCVQNNLDSIRCRSSSLLDEMKKLSTGLNAQQLDAYLNKSTEKRKPNSSWILNCLSEDESITLAQARKAKTEFLCGQAARNVEDEQDASNYKGDEMQTEGYFLLREPSSERAMDKMQCEDIEKTVQTHSDNIPVRPGEKAQFNLDDAIPALEPSGIHGPKHILVIEDDQTSVSTKDSADIYFFQDKNQTSFSTISDNIQATSSYGILNSIGMKGDCFRSEDDITNNDSDFET